MKLGIQRLDHLSNHFASFALPFLAVMHGIIQILVTRHTKDTAILELFGQGDNV